MRQGQRARGEVRCQHASCQRSVVKSPTLRLLMARASPHDYLLPADIDHSGPLTLRARRLQWPTSRAARCAPRAERRQRNSSGLFERQPRSGWHSRPEIAPAIYWALRAAAVTRYSPGRYAPAAAPCQPPLLGCSRASRAPGSSTERRRGGLGTVAVRLKGNGRGDRSSASNA